MFLKKLYKLSKDILYKTDYITAHKAAVSTGRVWMPKEFVSPEITWRP